MRIAFFHELHAGGARRASNEFAKVFRNGKHTVDLYIVDELPEKKEKTYYDKVFFYSFLSKKWNGGDWKSKLYRDSIELFRLRNFHKKIAQQIDNKNYDVVLVFPSKLTQAPFILNFLRTKSLFFAMEPLRIVYDPTNSIPKGLDVFRYSYEWLNRLNRKIIDKKNIYAADAIIAPSKYSADFSNRIYKKPVKVAYLGVNAKFFTKSSEKRNIDILFIGSKDAVNGYDFFREIVTQVQSKANVREVLFENEWLNDEQIRDLYRKTKILVATSYKELLGLIPLEAMACGTVVLAVDEAGYRETIINKRNGFLINRNAKKFAEKIDYLLQHDSERKNMSTFASKNVGNVWDWEVRAKELLDILKNY